MLAEVLMGWKSRYLAQIRRHNSGQRNLYDPEGPWRSIVDPDFETAV